MGALARLAVVAVAILSVVLITRDCVPSRVVFPSATATAARTGPTAAPSATASATATPQTTFSLRVTDAELTEAAQTAFPQTVSGVTVRDPVVRTTAGGVRLTASARVFFGTTEFVMVGTPYASDGRVAVRVDSITLGGLGLPDSVRASSAAAVETAIARLVPANVIVQNVSLREGAVTIEGEARR
ncbi:MAG TPA: hypothetical protein VJP45_05950 [Candidatus Limnocylindria bacterium]|nr:hypothetical protein [Candidatus Limnocylindria bacterium]